MGVDELLQQTIDRAPDGGDQVQGLGAIGIGLKRSLHGLHLPGNPSDPLDQVILVFVNVRHTYTPYPYIAHMFADRAEPGKAQPDDRSA
ncbi:hypothetical protein D3C81_1447330 [compost metagenome]